VKVSPQYDPLTDKELDVDALYRLVGENIRLKKWQRADHYVALLAAEIIDLMVRVE